MVSAIKELLPTNLAAAAALFVALRIVHRLYYVLAGHEHYWLLSPYRPSEAFESFLKARVKAVTEHSFAAKKDGVVLRYRRIGSGAKFVYLANGVGTGLFMWLPLLQELLQQDPEIFEKITLIMPSFRGLFGSRSSSGDDVSISIAICADDILEIMAHLKVSKFHSMIGWSLGAQTVLTCCASRPEVAGGLFLLNPSAGKTLHSVLQPFLPMPERLGGVLSALILGLFGSLRALTYSSRLWDTVKVIALSPAFRALLELTAFFGGFPPEQPVYFHEYVRDTFSSREHTRSLIDLITSLDAPLPPAALQLRQPATIISGLPDVMTGVYHSQLLATSMPNAKHVMFTMGSHFVLIEWPQLVAKELLTHLSA